MTAGDRGGTARDDEIERTADEHALHERLTAAQCLRNAHQHIAAAYAQIESPTLDTPQRRRRMLRETLDAVDWIRRALEHIYEVVSDV